MKPLSQMGPEESSAVRFVCTDIDDTLTYSGMLNRKAFEAIWKLYDEGFFIIPVTGRPGGWCDCIIRQWPVHAVVGENGAFAYYRDGHVQRTLYHPEGIRISERRERFDAISKAVKAEVPGVQVAKDQPYRLFDTAYDFSEEADLGQEAAEKIKAIAESFGANAKISSIHVNVWFGRYDKLEMILHLLKEVWGRRKEECRKQVLYCGDSPNDEPMFAYFPLTAGVGNIEKFQNRMKQLPQYRSSKFYGEGFAEIADILLKKRNESY